MLLQLHLHLGPIIITSPTARLGHRSTAAAALQNPQQTSSVAREIKKTKKREADKHPQAGTCTQTRPDRTNQPNHHAVNVNHTLNLD